MFVRPVGEEKVADKIGAPEFRNGRDVVITPKGIGCGLALVLSLLACSWMLVQTRLGAGARGRATWGPWTGIVLVVLSCLPAGRAAKPRPQMTLPYFPWRHGLPSARGSHAMAAAGDGSVWLHGGYTFEEGRSDQLVKLDPQERRWHAVTTAGPRPSARSGHSLLAVDGHKLVLFGGNTDSGRSDELWTLDLLAAAAWTRLTASASGASAAWPSARYGHTMCVVGSSVLMFGGGAASCLFPCSTSDISDELWSLEQRDPAPGDRAWRWTLLNDVNVSTEVELWTQFNNVQEHAWPALWSSFTSIYDGDVILVAKETRWAWNTTVDLCSHPWIPCELVIRGARRCEDYSSEYDRSKIFSAPISERVCRGVAGCEWTARDEDSCQYALMDGCNEPDECAPGTDSTDCGRTPGPGVCAGTVNETALSSSGDEAESTASAPALFRSGSGIIECHVASGCTGVKVSGLALYCSSDVEAPAGPFQVSGNVEMQIEKANFSDCCAVQDGGVMRIYNGANVTVDDSIIQR